MKEQRIQLSDHFTYLRLYRFVLPTIIMMVFTSIYSVVDGLFVSNFVGGIPFAALNLIFPLIMILGSVGFMFGTGGTAVVSKKLGEKDEKGANEVFSMLVYITLIVGGVLALSGILLARPIARWFVSFDKTMSAEDSASMIEYCVLYARIVLAALPGFMLQNVFQGFFVTAEKPRLGLYVIVLAGCMNILLDYLFVAVFRFGLAGAALATAISQIVGGSTPLFYFAKKNNSLLRLGKTHYDGKTLLQICFNGSSELLSNVSMSLVTILYNSQLMVFAGINGVSAYGIIMYANFVFISIFIGYSIGSAPIVGYNYGAENKKELQNVLKKSLVSVLVFGILMAVTAWLLSDTLAYIFVSQDESLYNLTVHGFNIYAFAFLICGLNIFGSSFFTALSNGLISALISSSRILIQIIAVLVLPIFWGVEGIWYSIVVSEILSSLFAIACLYFKRKKYGYFGSKRGVFVNILRKNTNTPCSR